MNQSNAIKNSASLYLEDLHIGQLFESGTYAIDEMHIKTFAQQYNPQPFHLDDKVAKNTLFAGLAASGWHVASVTMRLFVESLPLANGLIGAGVEINWPRPTRPGDILRVTSVIEEMTPSRSRPERSIVKVRCETRNQRGETVQIMTPKLLVMRRGYSPA